MACGTVSDPAAIGPRSPHRKTPDISVMAFRILRRTTGSHGPMSPSPHPNSSTHVLKCDREPPWRVAGAGGGSGCRATKSLAGSRRSAVCARGPAPASVLRRRRPFPSASGWSSRRATRRCERCPSERARARIGSSRRLHDAVRAVVDRGILTRRGRLAQLGERCVRNAEVGSSILLPSTNLRSRSHAEVARRSLGEGGPHATSRELRLASQPPLRSRVGCPP
jgi:hypothetical protein